MSFRTMGALRIAVAQPRETKKKKRTEFLNIHITGAFMCNAISIFKLISTIPYLLQIDISFSSNLATSRARQNTKYQYMLGRM